MVGDLQEILRCVSNLQVFDRYATFPEEPARSGEYQVLVRWFNDFRAYSNRETESVCGVGPTERDAALDALMRMEELIDVHERRLADLKRDIQERRDRETERWTCPMCMRRRSFRERSMVRAHLCEHCSFACDMVGALATRVKPAGLRWAAGRTNGWTYCALHRDGKFVGWVVAGPRYSEAVREPGATLMTGTLRECSDALVEHAKWGRDD